MSERTPSFPLTHDNALLEESTSARSVRRLQRELVGWRLRQMVREEAFGAYWARVGLFLVAGAFTQLGTRFVELFGPALRIPATSTTVWVIAVTVSGAATLFSGFLWVSARQTYFRTQLRILAIRLDVDDAFMPTGVP